MEAQNQEQTNVQPVRGLYFLPGTEEGRPASLNISGGNIVILQPDGTQCAFYRHKDAVSYDADGRPRLCFTDGGAFLPDNPAVLQHFRPLPEVSPSLSGKPVEVGVILTRFLVIGGVLAGITVAAVFVIRSFLAADLALFVGQDIWYSFSNAVLEQGQEFEASALTEEQQAEIADSFRAFIAGTDAENVFYDLRFKKMAGDTANAFAMPGGLMVLTDDMVYHTENSDELNSVLAHELGHIYHRHPEQGTMQNGTTALIMYYLDAGTLLSMTSELLLLKYSREHEQEADLFSCGIMNRRGIKGDLLKQVLTRLEEKTGGGGAPEFMSTHPDTESRTFGVALGVAALIVVLSVMNGFERDLRSALMGVNAHLTVGKFNVSGQLPLESNTEITEQIRAAVPFKSVTPYTLNQALVNSGRDA
ncbi:hypothetical protein CHS0354_018442 [Potamilus streckersoni]|uniref:Metalloendopeptidase OMA1, mitochondrial n=1 Tax=Potamilus streckersoni TaxID=2493646 RepID=A0AAE0TBQ9_9BIVA|nr:hypothetical protein CHS0354_018442 [Potamilus streckersoni]